MTICNICIIANQYSFLGDSYIVDWEDWVESTEEDVWIDLLYIRWNLAEVRSGSLNDMSTWAL